MSIFSALISAALAAVVAIVAIDAWLYSVRARVLAALPKRDAVDRLGWLPAARAFAADSAAMFATALAIPFGWWMRRAGAAGPRGAVVLVHGLGVSPGVFWLLRRRLHRDGWGPVYCFAYGPFRGGFAGVARRLHAFVNDVSARTGGRPLTLIGHNVGGLLARYCLRGWPHPNVRRLVTLGAPHNGTVIARRLWPLLAPDSPLLRRLNADDPLPKRIDVIAIHSTFDATVVPPACARYPEAFNVQLNDVGHAHMLYSRRVYTLLAENLAAPLPG